MHPRTFRFAVVAALAPTAQAWQETALRAEELGYDTLLAPDTMTTLEPFTALAAAATATERLRVGTFVLPVPFYPPSEITWRALALDLLSGGRFDLGLGAGRRVVPVGDPGRSGEEVRLYADHRDQLAGIVEDRPTECPVDPARKTQPIDPAAIRAEQAPERW